MNSKKKILYGLRGAAIAFIIMVLCVFFAFEWPLQGQPFDVQWPQFIHKLPAYLISTFLAMAFTFLTTIAVSTNWTNIPRIIDEYPGMSVIVFIIMFCSSFMLGLEASYAWDLPVYVFISITVLSFVYGLLGRGFAIIHILSMLGLVVILSAELRNLITYGYLFGGLTALGYLVNRIAYFLFVHKHKFLEEKKYKFLTIFLRGPIIVIGLFKFLW